MGRVGAFILLGSLGVFAGGCGDPGKEEICASCPSGTFERSLCEDAFDQCVGVPQCSTETLRKVFEDRSRNGCGMPEGGLPGDAGVDAGQDGGMDAGQDGGMDAGQDAGMDAGDDAGEDPDQDAGQ